MTCKTIKIGEATAFICGCKPDHECNDRGPIIYGFSDGDRGTLFDKCKAEKVSPQVLQMCDRDKLYFLEQMDITTTSGSVSCSICGRAAIDNAMWI